MKRTGRPCKVCAHPRRREIDGDLRAGLAVATMAEHYGLPDKSGRALQRHRAHLAEATIVASQPAATAPPVDMARLLELKSIRALVEAEASPNPRLRSAALRQARENLEAAARARASSPPDYAALRDPILMQLRDRLAAALRPYPEAALAAAAALAETE